MKSYKVLSIDAWGNAEDGFEWNQWFNAGVIELDGIEDDDWVLCQMQEHGFIDDASKADIEDDQFNLVVVDKITREPVFAIEYGSTI
jgi:hypothetical protein